MKVFITFHIISIFVEAFVPMVDQFEIPNLIQPCQLLKEPNSHSPFDSGVKLHTAKELLYGSKQMEIGSCRSEMYGGCAKTSQIIPAIFHDLSKTHADERCRAIVECVDLSPNFQLSDFHLFGLMKFLGSKKFVTSKSSAPCNCGSFYSQQGFMRLGFSK